MRLASSRPLSSFAAPVAVDSRLGWFPGQCFVSPPSPLTPGLAHQAAEPRASHGTGLIRV